VYKVELTENRNFPNLPWFQWTQAIASRLEESKYESPQSPV